MLTLLRCMLTPLRCMLTLTQVMLDLSERLDAASVAARLQPVALAALSEVQRTLTSLVRESQQCTYRTRFEWPRRRIHHAGAKLRDYCHEQLLALTPGGAVDTGAANPHCRGCGWSCCGVMNTQLIGEAALRVRASACHLPTPSHLANSPSPRTPTAPHCL
jgi:hypothetical protein